MHDGHPMWFHPRGVVSCRILQSPGKSPHTSPSRRKHARYRTKHQWSSDSPMDLDDELPRIQHRLECIRNPVAVKQRRHDVPVPVTEKTGLGQCIGRTSGQHIQTMMKKGWNRCPTQKTKVMERMTPLERWNGLAWVCTVWLWKGLARGGVCSGTTVFPQTQHVRLVRFSLFGCDLITSISSQGIHGKICESAQTDDCPGNHPRSTPQADVSRNVRHVLEDVSNGWIQTA